MQKAIIVRTVVEDGREGTYSFEVDPVATSPLNPLRRLLAAGWEVVHVCPMTNELDSASLVILDKPSPPGRPSGKREFSLVDMNHPAPWQSEGSEAGHATAKQQDGTWDGETIPLGIFRVDPPHVEPAPEVTP